MNINNRFALINLAVAAVAASLVLPAAAEEAANANPHTGKATVKLEYVHAVQENGSLDPAHNAACQKQVSNFIGLPVTSTYSIDTQSLKMSANSAFPSPNKIEPLELKVDLPPLGIANIYAFGTFRPPVLKQAYGILFSVSTKYDSPNSTFILFGPKGENYNCVISSSKDAKESAESSKFGVTQ
jgi:hypothetical protein